MFREERTLTYTDEEMDELREALILEGRIRESTYWLNRAHWMASHRFLHRLNNLRKRG